MSKRAALVAGIAAVMVLSGASGLAPLGAQEVVQSLPPREAADLNNALRRLASRPTDLDALVSAGNASLALNDAGAAAGFFGRAARVASGDARVMLGLARVALAQGRPIDALQAFAQAESAGVRPLEMAADRALAYDLVGDNATAQGLYRSVLDAGENAEVRRRLALSYAIAGNRGEFERVLFPLLRGEDRAAFRTRAFGLAILGQPDEAVEIADAMMPTDLALRMAPYLRYMPRLTRSQQAAAGNLGAFPAATEIGRDPADIAGYASAGARIAANASASLTPAGTALGPRPPQRPATSSADARRRPDREAGTTSPPVVAPAQNPVRVARAEQTVVPARAPQSPPAAAPTVLVAAARPASEAAPAGAPAPPTARESLSDAFADLGVQPVTSTAAAPGAVDVVKLAAARRAEEAAAAREAEAKAKARREADAKAAKAKAERAAREAEPARVWLQVGVGRNTAAFAFDWKKLAKQAGGALDGKGPWAAKYGATNRMLAGPFPSDAAARAAIKRLKERDIEALPFTSDEGEKVTKIG